MPATAPLVTVVIPCYNHALYLHDAIDSVRRQSYAPVEAIVVDDGSTDDSAKIARAEADRVVGQANAGLGAARNAGLAAAAGEFVVFLDADDELLPSAVESGVAILGSNAALAAVVRRCQVMDADRRTLPAIHTKLDTTDLYREWLHRNFVWTPGAAVFRTAAMRELGGFPASLGPAADYAVYLALSRKHEVAFDDREAVRYRQHESNMSRDPVLMLRHTLRVLAGERRKVPSRYRRDFRTGVGEWRQHYGEQIIERLRRERRAGQSGEWQKQAVLALVTHCPRVLATHAARKIGRLVRGLSSAPIEAGRFGPEVPPAPRERRRPVS